MFQKFSGIRKVYENKGGGGRGEGGGGGEDAVSQIPVGYSLSHITEKLRKRILLCFETLQYGKISCISGESPNFLSKVF